MVRNKGVWRLVQLSVFGGLHLQPAEGHQEECAIVRVEACV